jgi:hypothetical protein
MRKNSMRSIILMIGIVAFAWANAAWAANLAYDDASDPAYSGGWTNGSNGGYGFDAWIMGIDGTSAGFFIGDSTLNGDGVDDGNLHGVSADGDINSGVSSSVAWGLFAYNTSGWSRAVALRPFTGGPLSPGQTFSVDFDHGYVATGGLVAVGFLDASDEVVLAVIFYGGTTFYTYGEYDGVTNNFYSTGLGHGDEGVNLTVTMTGPTTYQAALTRFDGANVSWSGAFSAPPVAFGAEANMAGPDSGFYFFINSMSIVPEPSAIALGALGAIGVSIRAIRRRFG